MPGLTRPKTSRHALDWRVARERLDRMVANDGSPDPALRERILRERARRLAQPPQLASVLGKRRSAAELELLQFELGEEHYAIETRYVHQVLVPGELTRLPGAPPQLRGVTNLRGEILPVFAVHELLEAVRSADTERARWLLLGDETAELCLAVDAVEELCFVDPSTLIAPERDDRSAHLFVRGITADARSVFDAARLLTHRELFIGEAPAAESEKLT